MSQFGSSSITKTPKLFQKEIINTVLSAIISTLKGLNNYF